MKYTLKDIAKESGLSIATVSRFLCGKRRYYNLKEQHIFNLANKYHYPYIQNFYNNGIKLKVSLITTIGKGEFFSSLLSDFHIAAKNSNCDIEVIDIEKDIFIIGGSDIINQSFDLFKEFYLTRIYGNFECDKFIDINKIKNSMNLIQKIDCDDTCHFEIWRK